MLETVFLLAAVVGGAVFLFQFALLLLGMGGEGGEAIGDLPDDVPADFADPGLDAGGIDAAAAADGSTWLFGALSLRTVVSAVLFFGLFGIAARQAGASQGLAVLAAAVGGAAAFAATHWLMRTVYRLGQDSTLRLHAAVGCRGSVYVPIPGGGAGIGKIQLRLQNRIVECSAITNDPEKLPTGATVEVVRMVSPTTVEVRLAGKPAHHSQEA